MSIEQSDVLFLDREMCELSFTGTSDPTGINESCKEESDLTCGAGVQRSGQDLLPR